MPKNMSNVELIEMREVLDRVFWLGENGLQVADWVWLLNFVFNDEGDLFIQEIRMAERRQSHLFGRLKELAAVMKAVIR